MREHLRPLTSLRFFAAALIVVHHTRWYFGYGDAIARVLNPDIGVGFFYVLSGFIMFYTYREISASQTVARFLVSRVARIWPLHFATLLLVLIFLPYPWGPAGTNMTAVGLNVLLLQSWIPFPNYFFSLNGVSWSLSVEMFFYCMFPLISYHWRVTWWWKIALCGLVVIGLVHYASAAKLPFETPEEILSIDALVYILPLARLPDFVLGIGACSIWLHVRHSLSTLPAFVSSVLEVSCLGLTFAAMHWVGPLVWSMMTANIISQAGGKWLSEGAVVPVMALMICVLATGRGMVSRLLSHRSLVLLGEISFSIYMTHQILMRALVPNRNLLIFGGMAAQYAAYWILVLFVSFLLWQFVEKPCRRGIVEVYDRAVA